MGMDIITIIIIYLLTPTFGNHSTRHSYKDKRARSMLLELTECFPVFPSPSGCNNHGKKGEFVRTLKRIATRMNSTHPKTLFKWDPDLELPVEMVIKCDYSNSCRHIFLPMFLCKEPPVQDIEKDRKWFKR